VVAEGHTGVHGAQEARVRCGVRDGAVKRRDDDETKRRVATIRRKRVAFSLPTSEGGTLKADITFTVLRFITRLV
jgi:hypothetical protein